jgi:hypothetical protein
MCLFLRHAYREDKIHMLHLDKFATEEILQANLRTGEPAPKTTLTA